MIKYMQKYENFTKKYEKYTKIENTLKVYLFI